MTQHQNWPNDDSQIEPDSTCPPALTSAPGVAICIPVFNDWICVFKLLEHLDKVLPSLNAPVRVILVDDGSNEPLPINVPSSLSSIAQVDLLQLRRNVGHQRAIALGLAFINANCPVKLVVVMDSDGEDSPCDITALVHRCQQAGYSKIVFAKRRKRTEGLVFRAGYLSYKVLHFILTGHGTSIGNFSVIPATILPKIVGVSEIWNHYAAGVVHARLPLETVPADRARRLAGKSKMNLVSLVTHGLSAIAVYGDIVGVRLLCAAIVSTIVLLAALVAVVGIRLFTDMAIPGWATNAFGLLLALLLNLLMLTSMFVFFVLQSRSMAGFVPVRDWKDYVASQTTIFKR